MKKTHQKQNGSITLGMVFGLGMLGLGIAASTLLFATHSVSNNSIAGQGIRSLVTADSASREGIYRIIKDYELNDTAITFAGAAIPHLNDTDDADVTVTGSWPVFEVNSRSHNPRTTRVIKATLDMFPSALAFEQAVYTNGNLNLGGSALVNGNVYASAGVDVMGNNAEIIGNAYTPTPNGIDDPTAVTGTIIDNYEEIIPPEIDISSYKTAAILTNTFYTNGAMAGNVLKNTNTGTFYIEDDITINGSSNGSNITSFSGTLIVTGDLTITGGNFTAVSGGNPLVIYVGGNLTISGGATLNGIVYVKEDFAAVGNTAINGSLLATNVTDTGNIEITYIEAYATAWQNIEGINYDSGTAPMVKNWHEE